MCAPFALSSIELIIQAMICNFKGSQVFVDTFWNALTFCSKLEEVV